MGSFRSAAAQAASGQAMLLPEHRPAAVAPADWLQPGEWITYWSQMPHGLAADIAEAATLAVVDTSGNRQQRRSGSNIRAEYRAGRAAIASFIAGIVNWNLTDESGASVPFVPAQFDDPNWYPLGKATMSALPGPVVDALQRLIDSGSPPSLDSLPEDAEHEEDTEGNG